MTAREQAIEAATKALEAEMQQASQSIGPVEDFPRVLAEAAAAALAPVLLNDLADRIEAERVRRYVELGENPYDAFEGVQSIVRAAAEGWGQ